MTVNNKRCETRLYEKITVFVEAPSGVLEASPSTSVIICNTLDISANGILIQMDDAVPMNSILRLYVELPNNAKALHLIGEVKWVIEEAQSFNIGLEIYDAEDTDIIDWKSGIAALLDN